MNYRSVASQVGILLMVFSGAIAVVAGWSAIELGLGVSGELYALYALLLSAGCGVAVGGALWMATRRGWTEIGRRDALLLVATSWIVGAALAALPYWFWASLESPESLGDPAFASFVNCYFESMSGLTTTGASVLTNIESIPRSLLLWRALTHWLGGLGIVVLFVAVLPMLGVGGKRVYRVEAPGPVSDGVRPRIQETARALWLIYVGLTLAEIILLRVCGLGWFESVCHTFATLATGGFSTRNASVGQIESLPVDIVIIVFMLLAGVNFGVYYQIWQRRWRGVWQDTELRAYLGLLLVGSVIVIASLWENIIVTTANQQAEPSLGAAVRHGVFQVVSIQTTTGFCTANFDLWPFVPKAVLIALMFVGGCGGSTGGGMKVARCVIVVKVLYAELEHMFRPNVIRPIRMGRTSIDADLRLATLAYVLIVVFLAVAGAGLLMVFETGNDVDITTAATASVATLNNIGPGLARVGAIHNFGWFTDASKLVMCLLMALGRLEVFAIAVLFMPRYWKSE